MDNDFFLNDENLQNDLKKINRIFNIDSIVNQTFNDLLIKKYYKVSSWAYGLFHSKDGSVHMAINYDYQFNKTGYQTQANEISESIQKCNAVLELGCGKGYNLNILAKKHKTASFYGLDISENHLKIAKSKNKLLNLSFKCGSFQNIPFEDNSLDLVFGVETICYSENIDLLLREINRVLKKGGKFIVYDAFALKNQNKNNKDEEYIKQLCAKSMAVNEFHSIDYWFERSKVNHFEVSSNDNLSLEIMPNLKRLYKRARLYLDSRLLTKLTKAVFPSLMLKNAIAGILMPYSVMKNIYSYNRIVMRKV